MRQCSGAVVASTASWSCRSCGCWKSLLGVMLEATQSLWRNLNLWQWYHVTSCRCFRPRNGGWIQCVLLLKPPTSWAWSAQLLRHLLNVPPFPSLIPPPHRVGSPGPCAGRFQTSCWHASCLYCTLYCCKVLYSYCVTACSVELIK